MTFQREADGTGLPADEEYLADPGGPRQRGRVAEAGQAGGQQR